ncbi:TonB-dependent receptor [Algivirga pacifica]|uniref:TonB-dependent receptor n=1 Tax=Algivirga pacifica TaxID=1162670 RepID=A0ABP9CX94_9BACT
MKYHFLLFLLLSFSSNSIAQTTLSGYIKDRSEEPIIGAHILLNGQLITLSNSYGYYSIQLKDSLSQLSVTAIGYASFHEEIKSKEEDLQKDINMRPYVKTLEEVEVSATQSDFLYTPSTVDRVSVEEIRNLSPQLLGEVDVLKTIQLLPGIQGGLENTGSFFVRGGDAGQNLILLDDVPVYNTAHLMGFLSAFNPDAIKDVQVWKGGFSAQYAGRLSSVVDIHLKEGNKERVHYQGDIGLLSTKLTVDGPLSQKSSFLLSGRTTPIPLLIRGVQALGGGASGDFHFYDLNFKMNYDLSKKNRVYAAVYTGQDTNAFRTTVERQGKAQEFALKWGNITSSLRWASQLSPILFKNTTAYFSHFKLSTDNEAVIQVPIGDDEFQKITRISKYASGLQDYGIKSVLSYYPSNNHQITGGIKVGGKTYRPNASALIISDSTKDNNFQEKISNMENTLFIENQIQLTKWLSMNVGLHQAMYVAQDTVFLSTQPRVALSLLLAERWSAKFSYNRMVQYDHLLTSPASGMPTDIWVPSDRTLLPEKADQWSGGVFTHWGKGWQWSTEVFYKQMENTIRFQQAFDFLGAFLTYGPDSELLVEGQENWREGVIIGEGKAYGIESSIKKTVGKITGSLAYTYLHSERAYEEVNQGNPYPFKYGRKHDVFLQATYNPNDRFKLNVGWVYRSGIWLTIPTSSYPQYNETDSEYTHPYDPAVVPSSENNFEAPAYHRLDISIQFIKNKSRGRKRVWSIGAYNAYNQKNAFLYEIQDDGIRMTSAFQVMPFVSYQFKI